jgi:hypothetical protein
LGRGEALVGGARPSWAGRGPRAQGNVSNLRASAAAARRSAGPGFGAFGEDLQSLGREESSLALPSRAGSQ